MPTPAEITSLSKEASSLAAQEPLIGDLLKKKVQEVYDYNKDITEPLNTATTGYLASPNVAREKFQDIFNPFTREKLVSQYTGQEAVPMLTLSQILGQRMGTMQDLIGAGTNAFKAQVAAKQGEANIAQKELENEIALAKSRSSGSGGLTSTGLISLFNALKPSSTQESQAVQAQSGLNAVTKLSSLLGGDNANKILGAQNFGILGRLVGGKDVQQYQDAAREAYDAFLRSRTGAALNLNEEKFYQQYIPSLTDDPTTREAKVNRLKNVFESDVQLGQNPTYILQSLLGGLGGSSGGDWEIAQ